MIHDIHIVLLFVIKLISIPDYSNSYTNYLKAYGKYIILTSVLLPHNWF